MSQTDLKSDAFCIYNQATSPFFWVMEPGQYENTYVFGEVGISAAGGTGGSYVRPDVIDISSFLSGRDDMLSKCQPPVPDLENLESQPIRVQNSEQAVNLLPNYTREKRSAVDLSSIDYNRWQTLDTEPQNARFVIEDMWPQRGGLDSRNFTKKAWGPKDSQEYPNQNMCQSILDPARACGDYCAPVSGYKQKSNMLETFDRRPSQEPEYPFQGPYSQQVASVGAAACGPNFFYGPNFDKGSCPNSNIEVLASNAMSLDKFPVSENSKF